jgi:pre-mRNA branch site protein p14
MWTNENAWHASGGEESCLGRGRRRAVPPTNLPFSTSPNTHPTPSQHSILYVRNLPFNVTGDEIYSLFGKYGAIRQVRVGSNKSTRGSAYVVFEDIYDAKAAADHLSGFNVGGRYLIVLYFNPAKRQRAVSLAAAAAEVKKMQAEHGVDGEQRGRG